MRSDRWRALGIELSDDDRIEPCSEDARPVCKVRCEAQNGRSRTRTPSLDLWKGVRFCRRQQEAIAHHYIADLSLDQVARVMGCENGTMKAQLGRARQHLARYMGADEDAGR